jgi:hypothetical protein
VRRRDDPARPSKLERHPSLDERLDPATGVVPHDPEWAGRFEREAAAIRNALGDVLVWIEHVGSTAVPDLPAKPIIDIQVSVRDIEEREAFVRPLETPRIPVRARSGFARLPLLRKAQRASAPLPRSRLRSGQRRRDAPPRRARLPSLASGRDRQVRGFQTRPHSPQPPRPSRLHRRQGAVHEGS